MTTLLLARLHERPDNLRWAVEAAVAGLQAVLQRTVEAAGDAARSKEGTPEVCDLRFGVQGLAGFVAGFEATLAGVCPCLRVPAVAHLLGPGTPRFSGGPCIYRKGCTDADCWRFVWASTLANLCVVTF